MGVHHIPSPEIEARGIVLKRTLGKAQALKV
jgi:hypothetical protein